MRRYVSGVYFLLWFTAAWVARSQPDQIESAVRLRLTQLRNDTATIAGLIRGSAKLQNYPDSAIAMLQKAFDLSVTTHYADGAARSLLGIGTQLFNKGEISKARSFFLKAKPYCDHAIFTKDNLLSSWYNNMASSYAVQGHYDSAAKYYYRALDNMACAKKIDTAMYATVFANLGGIWQKANQYKRSLFYSYRALFIASALKDTNRMADIYQNIGLAYSGLGRPRKGAWALRKAYTGHVSKRNFLTAQMDACALAMSMTNTDSALFYYDLALSLGRLAGTEPLHKIYIGLGYTYFQAKDYSNAILNLEKGMQRAKQLGFTADLALIYPGLADAYSAMKNYKLANDYRGLYAGIRDSMLNAEKIRNADVLEVKYRTAEKDRQLADERLDLLNSRYQVKQRNYLLILICFVIVGLSLAGAGFYRSKRRKWEMDKQRQELENLRSVMAGEERERTRVARELHDGVMVQLAVIKMKLRKALAGDADDNIDDILTQLDITSRELRQTAHNLMPDMLLENGLTDALFYYTAKLQKETGLNIVFQHYGELPDLVPDAKLYLYRIIQELLQNIIKHAHATKALLQVNYHPPLVSFSVEDNGIGFDKDVMGTGMGLKSIYSRLRVLSGAIDIKSTRHLGTTVFIELNIEPFIEHKTGNNVHQSSYSR